jgi:hypothetical protein
MSLLTLVTLNFVFGFKNSPTSFTALLASNLLAQFCRQIVIQILGLESPKVFRNLTVRPLSYKARG